MKIYIDKIQNFISLNKRQVEKYSSRYDTLILNIRKNAILTLDSINEIIKKDLGINECIYNYNLAIMDCSWSFYIYNSLGIHITFEVIEEDLIEIGKTKIKVISINAI